uniref:Chromatin protein Cren7 n=1 Tax=Saccharolobus solfataricus (strain ATCC 35092 / DSM 1617 / JCM 11322 / P2) TaxID=273057 RepID=UPI000A178812|nr:Chain A, Chromatin protein Cren7 [Saccharolobus solfataricus P2]5WVW_B Chain B, Chromatin protein Cren7 [Saccharolobus solfataricus P2]
MSSGKKPVKVKTPAGKEAELVPEKVWAAAPKGRKGVKIGLFKDPETGKYFRHKLPDDYPI